jgi:hypothetical protein
MGMAILLLHTVGSIFAVVMKMNYYTRISVMEEICQIRGRNFCAICIIRKLFNLGNSDYLPMKSGLTVHPLSDNSKHIGYDNCIFPYPGPWIKGGSWYDKIFRWFFWQAVEG